MGNITHAERIRREADMRGYLTEGLTTRAIAARMDMTQQAVHSFIKVRGWQTKNATTPEDMRQRITDLAVSHSTAGIASVVGRTTGFVDSVLNTGAGR